MRSASFAVVTYLEGELARFLNGFRAAATPDDRHLRAHFTVLPPRGLQVSDQDAARAFRKNSFQAIEVELGEVCTFSPASPTIYLDLRSGEEQLSQLNRKLESGPLAGNPDWPYVPHLTLAKLDAVKDVARVFQHARDRWRDYQGTRRFQVNELTLVREAAPGNWVDLASIHAAA